MAKQWAKHCQLIFAHYSATWMPQWKKKTTNHAQPRLPQFGKITLNESTSRDRHLTVPHAFRPVNELEKSNICWPCVGSTLLVDLRQRNQTHHFQWLYEFWSTFSFLLCCMQGQHVLPLSVMMLKRRWSIPAATIFYGLKTSS